VDHRKHVVVTDSRVLILEDAPKEFQPLRAGTGELPVRYQDPRALGPLRGGGFQAGIGQAENPPLPIDTFIE
jgi:hypothetical protein